jgi:hypothetical protein
MVQLLKFGTGKLDEVALKVFGCLFLNKRSALKGALDRAVFMLPEKSWGV